MTYLSVIFCLIFLYGAVFGLKCKNCVSVKGGVDTVIGGFETETDSKCEEGQGVPIETCGNSGDKCFYAEFEYETNILVGSISGGGHMRGCSSVQLFRKDGCFDLDEDAGVLNNVLNIIAGANLKGKICYCSTDNCDARCDGLFMIASICIQVWMLAVAGGVIVLLILCCICCCCCCSSKSSRGQVHTTQQTQLQIHSIQMQPQVVAAQPQVVATQPQVVAGQPQVQPYQPPPYSTDIKT